MKLLIVEDEIELCDSIANGLRMNGYEVDVSYDGLDASLILEVEKYDLIILDLNLPNVDGMDILKNFRTHDSETNILILSARGDLHSKIDGLDAGANDYLCKPFYFEELEARVRSLTRRKTIQHSIILNYRELSFHTKTRCAYANEKEIPLTRKELILLEYLLLNQNRPLSQEELIQHVWDGSVNPFSNSIRVHISALRKKLRNALGYDPITNKIGQGYILGEQKQ